MTDAAPDRRRTRKRRAYATRNQLAQAIANAKHCGLDVVSIELSPDGAIRLIGPASQPQPGAALNDFDKYADQL